MKKVILVLLDGVSRNYFDANRIRLPYLSKLADNGLLVRMSSDVPSVSLAARATMLTGKTCGEHGVYGNMIYDADLGQFRYGAPDDVTVPSLPELARAQGLSVANIGFGMSKAEWAQTFCPPWWLKGYIHKGRENRGEMPAEVSGWQASSNDRDEWGVLKALYNNGLLEKYPSADSFPHAQLHDFATENVQLQRAAALLAGDNPPDFLLTEICMPDDAQHKGGYESALAHFAMAQADSQIGWLVEALASSGRTNDYVFALAADHGHSPIDTAIYPEAFLFNDKWSAEGSILHAYLPDKAECDRVTEKLSKLGVVKLDNRYLPDKIRDDIICFLAPDRFSFEARPDNAPRHAQQGRAKYISSHGLRPDHPDDDRLVIFSGAGLPAGEILSADSIDFAATVADVLGVDLPTSGKSLCEFV